MIPLGELQGQHPQADHKIHRGQTIAKSLPDDEQLHFNGNGTVSNGHNEGEFIYTQNIQLSCICSLIQKRLASCVSKVAATAAMHVGCKFEISPSTYHYPQPLCSLKKGHNFLYSLAVFTAY